MPSYLRKKILPVRLFGRDGQNFNKSKKLKEGPPPEKPGDAYEKDVGRSKSTWKTA